MSRLKNKFRNLYKKENLKPEIKPMIKYLPDGRYQLECEHAKGAQLNANIILELKLKHFQTESIKTYFNVLERICKTKQFLS